MMSYKLQLFQQLQDTDKPTCHDFCIVMQARTHLERIDLLV